ncbi:hypothetical protein N9O61_04760 [Octadecabacter sp.]|nr:hypothetical protein [Octadecabacter sp.]
MLRTVFAGLSCAIAPLYVGGASAHGDVIHSGAQWSCQLSRPFYGQTGSASLTLLDESGFGRPSLMISFQDGTNVLYELNANWTGGMTFRETQQQGLELTLTRSNIQPTNFEMTFRQPTTGETGTLATCREN